MFSLKTPNSSYWRVAAGILELYQEAIERKRLGAGLKETGEKFQALFEGMAEGLSGIRREIIAAR